MKSQSGENRNSSNNFCDEKREEIICLLRSLFPPFDKRQRRLGTLKLHKLSLKLSTGSRWCCIVPIDKGISMVSIFLDLDFYMNLFNN